MSVWMFPGQGSQKAGMGADLFSAYADYVSQADAILGYSIAELCAADGDGRINQTQFTQPALFVVEVLSYLEKIKTEEKPDYAIGHSLGEYSALFAAGAFNFETGLKLVQKRGELMAQATGGGMLAVIGMEKDQIAQTLSDNGIDTIDVANFNTASQIIISGPKDDMPKAEAALKEQARMVMPLQVSGAFHSRYMQPAQQEFADYIDQVSFSPLQLKVIANVTAAPYTSETIKENLVAQIASSVRWLDTILLLKREGETEFVEVGPGVVLSKMEKQIQV
jgi:malonyl CoA-acyl carrier protein transacylase